jgi:hypothetical protein
MATRDVMPSWVQDYDFWIAYYGVTSQIDNINSIPINYIPKWLKPEKLAMWQYSDKGRMGGLRSSYDFNMVYPSYATKIGLGAPVVVPDPEPKPEPNTEPTDSTSIFFGGAVQYKKWLFEGRTPCHLMKISLGKVVPHISFGGASLAKTTDRLRKNNWKVAINCDGWNVAKIGKYWTVIPAGFNADDGRGYGKLGSEEVMFISKEGGWSLQKPAKIWTAFGITNVLVKEGIQLPITARTDIEPRSAFGLSLDRQYVYLLVADGVERRKEGLTYKETAYILQQAGCDLVGMFDGGGSSTLAIMGIDGKPFILNKPCGEEPDGQRMVMNNLGFTLKE